MPLVPHDQQWLEHFIASHDGIAGTVHRTGGGALHLTAAVRIPPPVLAAVEIVPPGKGMAGLAELRRQPVQTCNLQDDASGDVRPMAKLVAGQAAIALPLAAADGAVRAVVGISFPFEGEIAADTAQALATAAATLP